MRELVNELQDVAAALIPEAYRLGSQQEQTSKDGWRWLDSKLEGNREFLSHKLVPSFVEQLDSLEEWTEEIIAAFLLAQQYRVVQYGQLYWESVWKGFGERFVNLPPITGVQYGVARRLDPMAKSCNTCPRKAKVYPGWNAMIKECGGLPASFESNDECDGGCRCYLELVRL